MSARDLFRLDLPDDPDQREGELVPFPNSIPPAPVGGEPDKRGLSLAARVRPSVEHFTSGWRAVWTGDGLFGMRPRPVAELARQFWTAPKPYIRDALLLRIPYALYGLPVIVASVCLHVLLLIVSYPSLLAGVGLLVLFVSLFL